MNEKVDVLHTVFLRLHDSEILNKVGAFKDAGVSTFSARKMRDGKVIKGHKVDTALRRWALKMSYSHHGLFVKPFTSDEILPAFMNNGGGSYEVAFGDLSQKTLFSSEIQAVYSRIESGALKEVIFRPKQLTMK